MAIDLKGLSAQELKRLATDIKKQQTALNKRKPIAGVRKKVIALAKAGRFENETLVFLHTGGAQGLFGYQGELEGAL